MRIDERIVLIQFIYIKRPQKKMTVMKIHLFLQFAFGFSAV
jgi:hypothetical protein